LSASTSREVQSIIFTGLAKVADAPFRYYALGMASLAPRHFRRAATKIATPRALATPLAAIILQAKINRLGTSMIG